MNIVDMHSSWLVINSIIGCSNGCAYCFFQFDKKNMCKPIYLCSPEQAITELLKYKYYDESMPLCLFPSTDIFLNEKNIDYLLRILEVMQNKNIKNDIVLTTKCKIPEYVIIKLKKFQKVGINIVVYLSYSNLGSKYEPNVNIEDIKENFRKLHMYKIPIIHYFRPLIEENSSKEKIDEVLTFVKKYTNNIVVTGLMYVNNKELFKGLTKEELELVKSGTSMWTEKAWTYLYNEYNGEFFQTNMCALSKALNKPCYEYYDTFECTSLNHCTKKQQTLCASIKRKKECFYIEKLKLLLNKLGYKTKNLEYEFNCKEGIEIKNIELDVKTLAYLSHILKIKVYVKKGLKLNDLYTSTLTGSRPYILRRTHE